MVQGKKQLNIKTTPKNMLYIFFLNFEKMMNNKMNL